MCILCNLSIFATSNELENSRDNDYIRKSPFTEELNMSIAAETTVQTISTEELRKKLESNNRRGEAGPLV